MARQFDVKFYHGYGNGLKVEAENIAAHTPEAALMRVLTDNGFKVNDFFPLRWEQPVQRYNELREPVGLYRVWSAGLTFGGQRAWIYERIGE